MDEIVNKLRKSFNTHETKTEKWRREQLMAIDRMLDEHKDEFCEANKLDLNKAAHETITAEIGLTKNAITFALHNLSTYMKPQKTTPIIQVRALYSTYVQYQPYGVVLVMSAWNYPLQLLLIPMIGAIACGNCVLAKPSEISGNMANLFEKLWPKYFDSNYIALVNGGINETTELLKQRFDYIFYTGSTPVGKIIAAAAV